MSTISLEVCVDNLESLRTAADAGADRIELCSALELGGLTPCAGFMMAAADVSVPVHALIRPRTGDFDYSRGEVDQMVDDVQACREVGLAGIVIGAGAGGWLDETSVEALVDAAGDLCITLHRVFDLVDDRVLAIDIAADLGIERILTSGGAHSAPAGIEEIRRCVEHADSRLSIMAGGGIDAANVAKIVEHTGVRDIHGSFSRATRQFDPAIPALGFSAGESLIAADGDAVRAVRHALSCFSEAEPP